MEQVSLQVGTVVKFPDGQVHDTRRPVEFEADKLAEYTEFSQYKGVVSENRGQTQELYQVDDGRFVVYLKDWSDFQGEPTGTRLLTADHVDLAIGGKFERLGALAGFGRALTLDEALALADPKWTPGC